MYYDFKKSDPDMEATNSGSKENHQNLTEEEKDSVMDNRLLCSTIPTGMLEDILLNFKFYCKVVCVNGL